MSTMIEWVQNPDGTRGFTCNSKTGCRNCTPEGLCLGGLFPCYACRLANTRLTDRYLANSNVAPLPVSMPADYPRLYEPFYPRWWPERLEQIRKHKKSAGIFLDDMSDWMGDYWPEEWTEQELQVMRDCPQHRFYTLTKQPQNLAKWSPFPDNCWVGVTATSTRMFVEAMDNLLHVEAKVEYISLEPLLEWDIDPYILEKDFTAQQLDWLIIGAQTKPYKPPKLEWVQEIVEAADSAGVAVFIKNNLQNLCWQNGISARQEMPDG